MKYLLTLLFCCVISFVNAQESMKGYWRVNNNVGMGQIIRDNPYFLNQTYIITPSLSRFVTDKTLIGLDLRFIGSQYVSIDSNGDLFSIPLFGAWVTPRIRQYFGNFALKPFIGSKLQLGFVGKFQTATTEKIEFEANLESGLTYFMNKHLSIDFGLDVGFVLNNDGVSLDPISVWSFKGQPNFFLSSNIYLPVSYRAQRKSINPYTYQQKGTQVFALNSEYENRLIPLRRFIFNLNYSRHITDKWLLGGAIAFDSFLSRPTNSLKIFTRKYTDLPLEKLQGYGEYSLTTDFGYYYLFQNATLLAPKRAYSLHNRAEIGIQYALSNNIIKLGIGTRLHSITGEGVNYWNHKLIHHINLEVEHFWSDKVSFFAGALITPQHRYLILGSQPLQFQTNSFSQLSFGHRIYFTK